VTIDPARRRIRCFVASADFSANLQARSSVSG
jgi:hypothetical protein